MIGLAAAGWLIAAALLWRTAVPELSLVDVDPAAVFPGEYLERSERYARFHRVNWVLATLVQLVVLVVCVRLAPRFRVRGIAGGVLLGLGTLAAVWLAGLPFVLAAQWWRRRYDVSDGHLSLAAGLAQDDQPIGSVELEIDCG